MRWIIDGGPRTYSNAEGPWKEAIAGAIPPAPHGAAHQGMVVTFRLLQKVRSQDIDNLCEPVFSVIVNRFGWFGGRRKHIRWWLAARHVAPISGCTVEVVDDGPPAPPASAPIFDKVFSGALPTGARDAAFSDWVMSQMPLPQSSGERFTVCLQFGDSGAKLGDIASGPIKHVIDCLYPVLGGIPGAPQDWRIQALQVEKGGTAGVCAHSALGALMIT